VPPQLLGIVPTNNAGFGKVDEALDVFYELEIVPLMRRMLRMNDWFGVRLLSFRDDTCTNGDRITETGERVPARELR